jgi:hydroxymethylglutaryl-CoA lyase
MNDIIIHEVGLRDGLQMEKQTVPFEKKIEWAKKFFKAGIDIVQIGSFVHPVKMPQMADTDKLFEYFNQPGNKPENVILSGLVLNEKGLERGMKCGVQMFCVGVSASETHSMKNTGMSVQDATTRIIAIAKLAKEAGKMVQVSVQSAFGCGFEGAVPEEKVIGIVEKYLEAGFKTISLADTAGHANPQKVERLFSKILEIAPDAVLACHFHNTYGMGMANTYAALNVGVKYFETGFGGIGGCPFTKQPAGNISTEDVVHYFQNVGIRKDIDLDELINLAKDASEYFGRPLPGYVYKAGKIKE